MSFCLKGALLLFLFACTARADQPSFTDLVAQGDAAVQQGYAAKAWDKYSAAAPLAGTNGEALCVLTRRYCDLAHIETAPAEQKRLQQLALTTALRAVEVAPQNATAHLSVAVCYFKNFPYANNRTKVEWSREIKLECEKGLALDPRQDIGYYILGRWNYGIANMKGIEKGLAKIFYGGLPAASNQDAIQNFKKAIQLAPNRIIHHASLAKVYETIGQPESARAEYRQCVSLKPVDADDVDAKKDAQDCLAQIRKQK